MYIVDDIAYANDSRPAIRVCGVRPPTQSSFVGAL